MSTRCNIIIKSADDVAQIYQHCDGYPEYVGEVVQHQLNDYKGEMTSQAVTKYLAPFFDELEDEVNLHGDIDFLYVVDTDERTITCYFVFIDGGADVDQKYINGEMVGVKVKSRFDAEVLVYQSKFDDEWKSITFKEID